MKSLFKKVLIAPTVCSFLTPIIAKADLNIPAGTIHYLEQNNSIYTSGGTYNGKTGIKSGNRPGHYPKFNATFLNGIYDHSGWFTNRCGSSGTSGYYRPQNASQSQNGKD